MTDTRLPADLQAAITRVAEGRDRGALRESSARISEHYRAKGASRGVIGADADAIAYALSRMPGTYAAVATVLAELVDRAPDFAPTSLLDAGAGPGTAGWAVSEAFPGIDATLLDHSPEFLALARDLGLAATTVPGDLTRFDLKRRFDLVTCAYALTELGDAAILNAAERLWTHTDGILVIAEPGRPRDYERLMAVRARLIELGGTVLAPCPHDAPCPLVAPDWCHFSVRLNRSREHMRMKGGTLGYEDEKFSYLVVARPGVGKRATARVIRPPEENKFSVSLPLCGPHGTEVRVVPSRDKVAFKAARKLGWGDSVESLES
jgi:ribosomal protein RSM22 (predicted rRNA methylase)